MSRYAVYDASCLIDLEKGRLFRAIRRLPYRFMIPLPIRESELFDFTPSDWRILEDGGLITYDLPAEEMARALDLHRRHASLSTNDCVALVTAACHDDAILLTGDSALKKVAASNDICVHGSLWIIDELHAANACENDLLVSALERWKKDGTVFLPPTEIEKRLARLKKEQRPTK